MGKVLYVARTVLPIPSYIYTMKYAQIKNQPILA